MADVVERPEVAVMYRAAHDEVASIRQAWEELEEAVGSLRGRRFFGVGDPARGEYRACVEIQPGDDPQALGLERGSLDGGRYLHTRLRGEPPGIYEEIGPAFGALAASAPSDETRPGIEYYRRHDVIDLYLPIA